MCNDWEFSSHSSEVFMDQMTQERMVSLAELNQSRAVITDAGRDSYGGDMAAFYAAVDLLRRDYEQFLKKTPAKGTKYHLVLAVEKPGEA
jgi:hypothetical protein